MEDQFSVLKVRAGICAERATAESNNKAREVIREVVRKVKARFGLVLDSLGYRRYFMGVNILNNEKAQIGYYKEDCPCRWT